MCSIAGYVETREAGYSALAEKLLAEGYDMDSRVMAGENRYNTISDGASIHMSDVMCQLIFKKVNDGESIVRAALVYSILYSINKQGRLKLYNVSVLGVYEGIEAPEARRGIL